MIALLFLDGRGAPDKVRGGAGDDRKALRLRFRALLVECKQARQHLVLAQPVRPAIGGSDGAIERLVGMVEPGRAGIVEIGQGAFKLIFCDSS